MVEVTLYTMLTPVNHMKERIELLYQAHKFIPGELDN